MKHTSVYRLFVAVEVPNTVSRHVEAVQAALMTAGAPVKWTRPEGVHLTLKFLGDVDANRVDELTRALTKAARGMPQFQLQPGHLGAFPSSRRPSVLWLALEGEVERLTALHRQVDKALRKRGFKADRKGFRPHLTLGRVRRDAAPHHLTPLVSALASIDPPECPPWEVSSFALVRSELFPTGARYTTLARIDLEDA